MFNKHARPLTLKQLRLFLGVIGYYRPFIFKFANYSAKLTPSTSSKAPNKVVWPEEMNKYFCALKEAVCETAGLTIPCNEDTFLLQTDVSGLGVGGVFSVITDGITLPTAFFSRQLKQHQ